MKRRSFLGSLVALVCAPFVPKPKPVRPAFTLPIPMVDMRGLFNPSPEVAAWMDRERYSRVGETIYVKLPERFKATDSLQPHLHEAMVDFELARTL